MSKDNKKKPAKPPAEAKTGSSVTDALHGGQKPGQTKPTDAGRPSADMGGKGASSKKGR